MFKLLVQKGSAPWIPEGDIKGCFDNFRHGWLESHIPMDRKVLREWLEAGYMESGKLFPTEAGTPQEGVASPTIANIALDGLDAVLTERFGQSQSAIHRNRMRLVRYADDVRHITRRQISLAEGGGTERNLWVNGLPELEREQGQ